MAVIPVDASKSKGNWLVFEWAGVTENDSFGAAHLNHNVSDILIEVSGTIGGATITLTGYVETSTVTFAMVDPSGTAISFTAVGTSPVRDAYRHFVPVRTGGSSASITVRIYLKKVN